VRPRFADANTFGHGFNYCRVMYTSNRREAGGQGWSTDFPDAERNFSKRLAELTKMRVSKDPSGEANHIVVRLTDPELDQCAYVSMEDAGTAQLSDAEVEGLRAYLLKGGFLWLDDYWGDEAWDQWIHELARVLPPDEYPTFEITPAHPVFREIVTPWRKVLGDNPDARYHDATAPGGRAHRLILVSHPTPRKSRS